MMKALRLGDDDLDKLKDNLGIPLGRLGTPLDQASAALFLASKASSWITGQTLIVTGGM
jgi:NAD(P)-dependent dehydrogenase (short-subunit alcohol dehydrogenase family)